MLWEQGSTWRGQALVVAGVLAFVGGVAAADTICVPDDYDTIQEAIDAAVDGDEVVVADGTWTGTGNRDLDFAGRLITVRSEHGPGKCIIDCAGTEEDPHRGFYFHSGETSLALVDGFTITNGLATGDWPLSGGGAIHCDHSSPTIAHCILLGNFARTDGGGIYNVFGSSPAVTQCTFIGNRLGQLGFGGGICNEEQCNPVITGCTFSDNAARWGGGISNHVDSSPTVTNCTFTENRAHSVGGGMYNEESSPTVTNCTFSGNTATTGGGMSNGYNSSPTVTNCVLWGDSPDEIAGTATVTYSDVQGGYAGIGNIDADPMCDADGRPQAGSPCIDAGDNDAVPAGITEDLDGNPRFVEDPDTEDTGHGTPPIVDMGAYEFQLVCPEDLDGSGAVDFGDILAILSAWGNAGGPADLDNSGTVDFGDILVILAAWGPCWLGACCFDDGTCDEVIEATCAAAGGQYRGHETTCASTCLGACCLADATCIDATVESECVDMGGVYQGDASTCAADCPTGACCIDDECIDGVTEAMCRGLDGAYQGDGSTCAEGCLFGPCGLLVDAPLTWNGTTCDAPDKCPVNARGDVQLEVTIPEDGDWTFRTCGSVEMVLSVDTTECCGQEYQVQTYCQTAVTVPDLSAGQVVFVSVEAVSGCGEFALVVTGP